MRKAISYIIVELTRIKPLHGKEQDIRKIALYFLLLGVDFNRKWSSVECFLLLYTVYSMPCYAFGEALICMYSLALNKVVAVCSEQREAGDLVCAVCEQRAGTSAADVHRGAGLSAIGQPASTSQTAPAQQPRPDPLQRPLHRVLATAPKQQTPTRRHCRSVFAMSVL